MKVDVHIKTRDKEDKKVPKEAIGFTGSLAVLFFLLSYYNQHLFYNGDHSHETALLFAVFAGLAGIFLLLFLGLLVSRLDDD